MVKVVEVDCEDSKSAFLRRLKPSARPRTDVFALYSLSYPEITKARKTFQFQILYSLHVSGRTQSRFDFALHGRATEVPKLKRNTIGQLTCQSLPL